MSPVAIGLLAMTMSIDAFIAALGRGAAQRRVRLSMALRTGLLFGAVEALTPLIGWGFGMAASQHVREVDHWIAFGLLMAVGLRMLMQALSPDTGDEGTKPRATGRLPLLATAIATSIDAMAVGVSLAFLEVNILVIALAIGTATLLMSAAGTLAGGMIGGRFGRFAEAAGGLVLMAMGAVVLCEHLAIP